MENPIKMEWFGGTIILGNTHLMSNFFFETSDWRDINNIFFIKHQFQVQSNVEDVAVMLRQMAEANGWETVIDPLMGTFVEELQA